VPPVHSSQGESTSRLVAPVALSKTQVSGESRPARWRVSRTFHLFFGRLARVRIEGKRRTRVGRTREQGSRVVVVWQKSAGGVGCNPGFPGSIARMGSLIPARTARSFERIKTHESSRSRAAFRRRSAT